MTEKRRPFCLIPYVSGGSSYYDVHPRLLLQMPVSLFQLFYQRTHINIAKIIKSDFIRLCATLEFIVYMFQRGWFGLACFFNDITTVLCHLMLKLSFKKNSNGTI